MSHYSPLAMLRILACALVVIVATLSSHIGMLAEDHEATPLPRNLTSLLINVSDIYPGARLVDELAISPQDFGPQDNKPSEVLRSLFVQGHMWSYRVERTSIVIMLYEFVTNEMAVAYAQEQSTAESYLAPDTFRIDQSGLEPAYVGVVGRLLVGVGVTGSSGPAAEADGIAKNLYLVQRSALPLLTDVSTDEADAIANRFRYVWSASTGTVLFLGLLASAGLSLATDRGLREWMSNGTTKAAMLNHKLDVTDQVQLILRRGVVVTVARIVVLGTVTVSAFAWPELEIVEIAALITLVVIFWQVLETWSRHRHARSESARGIIALLVIIVGGIASTALLVCGVVVISGAVGDVLMNTNMAESRIPLLPGVVVGLLVINLSRGPNRLARRLLQPTVRRQVEADTRAPILLLRSFQDDSLDVRPPFVLAGAIDTFAGESMVRFEEVIAWSAWERGPLRAIGLPGTRLQPLGAVRNYFDSDSWRAAVNEIADDAQAFVLIAGRSPGLMWEYENVRAKGMLAKSVFVFAPVDEEEAARRIAVVCTALDLNPSVLDVGDSRQVLALGFDAYGNPQVHVAAGRTADAYVAALSRALDSASCVAEVSKPADWAYLGSQPRQADLAKFDRSKVTSTKSVMSRVYDVLRVFTSV